MKLVFTFHLAKFIAHSADGWIWIANMELWFHFQIFGRDLRTSRPWKIKWRVNRWSRTFGMPGKTALSMSPTENSWSLAPVWLFLLGWINDKPSGYRAFSFDLLASLPYSNVQYYTFNFIWSFACKFQYHKSQGSTVSLGCNRSYPFNRTLGPQLVYPS